MLHIPFNLSVHVKSNLKFVYKKILNAENAF